MTSFAIQNFGCRVNQAEAFAWASEFQKRGLKLDGDFERSGLIIVNTCTLTGKADRDARRFIRRIIRLNPRAKVIVTGCLAERNPGEIQMIPGVWKIVSNSEKSALPQVIFSEAPAESSGEARVVAPFRSRALLKVQDGCNMACSFCIIPRVRGKSASLPKDRILARIRELADEGFREIVLTGIHLCSYGRDLRPKTSLLELLREIDGRESGLRIRLSSLDPRLLPRPWLEHFASSKTISPHFHLSLQHGSERVLQAMGRKSTLAEYRDIMAFLRSRSPEAALGADIIVGFPGETEEDFESTARFLTDSPLNYFHVFSYSPRPGTAASSLKPVDDKKRKERAARLRKLSQLKNLAFRKSLIGRELGGIVIQKDAHGAEILTGNYIDIRLPSCSAPEGNEVKVKILSVSDKETCGEMAG
jgi:threonylcarbamoyladenosine tRNA methylthiotransferase MtaB